MQKLKYLVAALILFSSLLFVSPASALTNGTTCDTFTYTAWTDCQIDGTMTRSISSAYPSGCTGGNPFISQTCTYVPPVCEYTYTGWSACQSNGIRIRNIASQAPAGCAGNPSLTETCLYFSPVTTCTSFTYTDWSVCQPDGTKTRSIISQLPVDCTGGSPELSATCSYNSPSIVCTSYTYSDWSACINGTKTRTYTGYPSGCTGTPSSSLTQSCISTDPVCNTFTYTDWSSCQPNGTKTRSVAYRYPTGCVGGSPTLSSTCSYVSSASDAITLSGSSGNGSISLSWTTANASSKAYKVVWGKEPAPVYPSRSSDSYHYFTNGQTTDNLTNLASGKYYDRVCNYINGTCYNYSNELSFNVVNTTAEITYCTEEYSPVCGPDGKKYSNACYAKKAGVTNYASCSTTPVTKPVTTPAEEKIKLGGITIDKPLSEMNREELMRVLITLLIALLSK